MENDAGGATGEAEMCPGMVGERACALPASEHGWCFWHCPCEVCTAKRRAAQSAGGTKSNQLRRLEKKRAKLTTPEQLDEWRRDILVKMQAEEITYDAGTSALWAANQVSGATNGHVDTGHQQAEKEILEVLDVLAEAGISPSVRSLAALREGVKRNTVYAGRYPQREFREGSTADYLWMLLEPDVRTIGMPELPPFVPFREPHGRVVWMSTAEREARDAYRSGIDPFEWLADLLKIEVNELLSRCARWDKVWLKSGKR